MNGSRYSIFGPYLSLPSVPGLNSPCETELLLFLKEVDLLFEQVNESWSKKLEDAESVCSAQKEELTSLKSALKLAKKELDTVRVKYDNDFIKYERQLAYSQKQTKDLKAESEKLKVNAEKKEKLLQRNDQEIIQLKKTNDGLQKEVQSLHAELYKKNQQLKSLEENYQKLLVLYNSERPQEAADDDQTSNQQLIDIVDHLFEDEEDNEKKKSLDQKLRSEIGAIASDIKDIMH